MSATRFSFVARLFAAVTATMVLDGPARAQEEQPPASDIARPPAELEGPHFPNTYSTLDAGRETHQRAERKRQATINAQLGTIEEIVWYNTWLRPSFLAPSLAARYAYPEIYGYWSPLRRPRRFSRAFRSYPGVYGPVFEPWPCVPGDIWGYPYWSRVEQPLGHAVIRTGPNSYIYRPVYPEDVQPKEAAAETQEGPAAAGQDERSEPPPEEIPPPPPETGPRIF